MDRIGTKFRRNLKILLTNVLKVVHKATEKLKLTVKLTDEQEHAHAKIDLAQKTLFLADDASLINKFVDITFEDWPVLKEESVKFFYRFVTNELLMDTLTADFSHLFTNEDGVIKTVVPSSHIDTLSRTFQVLIRLSIEYMDIVINEKDGLTDDFVDMISTHGIDEVKVEALKMLWYNKA